jgi:long-subunit acyl-CoA synthetase (AMP-forming)
VDVSEVESEVAKELRALLGGRLLVASSGGAPIAEAVLEFARNFLKVDLIICF